MRAIKVSFVVLMKGLLESPYRTYGWGFIT